MTWLRIGGSLDDKGLSIDADDSGNTYVGGFFKGVSDFDPGAGTVNLTATSGFDGFVAKYDSTGAYVWALGINGGGTEQPNSVVADGSGNVYVIGGFTGTVDFDPGVGTANVTGASISDFFITKYDQNGGYVWAKGIGGPGYEMGYDLALDGSGDIYTTGFFGGTVDFDPGTGTANLTAIGQSNVFLAKYDSSGNYVWAKCMQGNYSTDQGYGVVLDGAGNAYITGVFSGVVDFNPGAGTANLTSNGQDAYVAKYDSNGNYLWAIKMGSSGIDQATNLAVDEAGNVFATGYFSGVADFDPGAGTANLTASGIYDGYLAKYDTNGNYVWANIFTGSGNDGAKNVAVDDAGNVYVDGYFEYTIDFDPGVGTANLTSSGQLDAFVAKYDTNGNYVWARRFGSPSGEDVFGIAVDGAGNNYTTGGFNGSATVNSAAGSGTLSSSGAQDVFILPLTANGILLVPLAAPSAPGGLTLDTGSNSGLTTDTITNDSTPAIHGTATASSTVVLYDHGATALGSVTADSAGNWTITSASLADGAHTLTAMAFNSAGTSTVSSALTVTIDTTADAPASLGLTDATNSGSITDAITNSSSPVITGTVAEAATIILYDGAAAIGTVSASGAGAWTIAASLAAGAHTLTATMVDAAGNTSAASSDLVVTIDTTAEVPTGLALSAASNGGSTTDTLTNVANPAVTGTAEAGTIILYDGATAIGTANAAQAGAWTITSASLNDGVHTLTALVIDDAGNTSTASGGLTVTIDTTLPILSTSAPADNATGVATTQNLILTFSEAVLADSGSVALYKASDGTTAVETFSITDAQVSVSGSQVTLNPTITLDYSTEYYLEIASGAITDLAGNYYEGLSGSQAYNFTTGAAPPAPQQDDPSPTPTITTTSETADGMVVEQITQIGTDGTVTQTLIVPIVPATRTEQNAATTNADIPLVKDATTGAFVLEASLPVGVGLQVETTSASSSTATGQGLAGLIRAIENRTQNQPDDKSKMTGVGQAFLNELPANVDLTVRTITPLIAPGTTTAPNQPIVITGTVSAPSQGGHASTSPQQQALVIDVRNLPKGTVIQLQNVEFAAIVGDVRLTGGEGSQMVVGDSGAQYIVLGADDDTLRGGGGNDFVGSEGGDDVLWGDEGYDTVTGGIGNDVLYGNQQDDLVYGNQGADTIFGGQDRDTVFGGQDGDVLYGNLGADTLYGQLGDDTLFGGQGDDVLWGGQGNDVLYGNLGVDTLYGGQGADIFRFGSVEDCGDVIADFEAGVDTLAVVGPNFGNVPAGRLSASHFALGRPGDADDWFVFDTTTGTLSFDADGNGAGAAVTLATLNVRTLDSRGITVLAG